MVNALQRASAKPIDTKQWKQRDHKVKIEKFIATAVKMPGEFNPAEPSRQLIHWRGGGSYSQDGSERSTSFDTRKHSNSDPAIEVQLISKDFSVSSSAPYHWETSLAKEFTTTDVYDLLVAKKFNHYLYNGNGSGCLTWTTALIKLLEDEGVLPAGSEKSFLVKVAQVRADPKYWVPDEPGAKFYD
ncbi:hypothetical protein PAXINDRAFT_180501 [Paxillus involutus ATCC 200175]|uniref:DUF7770 domain-containing protein n=1 Tax=Paxillus involutus ATCC 200175 TaxID=664439 RepID=A0A0C9UA72_PAXIN|nr:hypothetical protein PAXINDRAFT_180501 [Paxillus involutus ATCC 200175]